MTCSQCVCFDVCDKLKSMCKQLVFGNVGKVIHIRLLTAVAQGCPNWSPKKIKRNYDNISEQLALGECHVE
jgi:hypothetical protein